MTESGECRAAPIKRGGICSQFFQYDRNASDFHLPCTMTMKGSTPSKSKWVVPPMQNLWPVSRGIAESNHALLQQSMNQVHFMGAQAPCSVLYANRGAFGGMLALMLQWLLKAARVLHLQPESVQQIHLPFNFVFIKGAKKPPYLTPLEANPCFVHVVLEAWRWGIERHISAELI